eukprot:scaffold11844_cov53-Attheya_sp.AAC.1
MGKRPSSVSARSSARQSPSKKSKQEESTASTDNNTTTTRPSMIHPNANPNAKDKQLVDALHEQVAGMMMQTQHSNKKNGRMLEEVMGQVERNVWPLFLQETRQDHADDFEDDYYAKAAHLVAFAACARASALGAYNMGSSSSSSSSVFGPD